MGFKLMENFNAPYFSQSTSEYWKRWHISLSSWFKDYLYIPLGGNRKGKLRKYINLVIVFFICGLWHGASWSYIVWGMLNGTFQVMGVFLKPIRDKLVKILKLNRDSASHKMYRIFTTFMLITSTLVFFRADTFNTALDMIKSAFTEYNPWIFFDDSLYDLGLIRREFQFMILSIIVVLIVEFIKWKGYSIREWIYKQERWFRWLFYLTSIIVIVVFGIWGPEYEEKAFIYFQF